MTKLKVTAGEFTFNAKLEKELAPNTCAAFEKLMPFPPNSVPQLIRRGKIFKTRHLRPHRLGSDTLIIRIKCINLLP